jgi:diamine N-acetyltransferase
MIILVPITKENYRDCMSLKVSDSQTHLVASNAKSLAEAYVYYDIARPYAIYNDEMMVGFLLLRDLYDLRCYYLSQFMIDERYQRKGFGKQAMVVLIDMLKREKRFPKIGLCYIEGEKRAKNLYEGLGFKPTGEVEANEILMELIIDDGQ